MSIDDDDDNDDDDYDNDDNDNDNDKESSLPRGLRRLDRDTINVK